MFDVALTYEEKVARLKENFFSLSTDEQKYHFLIDLGKALPLLSPEYRTDDRLVRGCQSRLYLLSSFREGKIYFQAHADALISAGLAAVLIEVYNGETPETVLKRAPQFLEEIGIANSLSPNRSNGLMHIHLRMKQDALKYFITSN
jgi:cysteine desulfuration protein SufE